MMDWQRYMTMEQYAAQLKKNIRDYWWKSMTQLHDNIVGIDAAIFMHPTTLLSK